MNQHDVRYLLIGGVNFLLRHQPVLTFDVDFWVEDSEENRSRCEKALNELEAEWGRTNEEWGPVSERASGWLAGQPVFCMNSPHGAVDVFFSVSGLDSWDDAYRRCVDGQTAEGTPYRAISDEDMLTCQLALPEADQKTERVNYLRSRQ